MSLTIPTVLNGLTGNVNSLLNAFPNQFQFAGSSANFGTVSGVTGSFYSVVAATGVFITLQANAISLGTAATTLATNCFVGSLASTGPATALLYNPVVARGVITTASGAYVSAVTVPAGWWRGQYSVNLSSVPSNAAVKAQMMLAGGTALADSVAQCSNLPSTATSGLGAVTVTTPAQADNLSGLSHFVTTAGSTLVTVGLSTTAGVPIVSNGSLELFQLN